MNELTRKLLYTLYAYAKPKSEHAIGLVFDPEFYYEALKLYDEKCDQQFKQKWDRYTFWNICVEEWLGGCLGTGFLRPHAQGFRENLTRRGCVLADGSSYFPFRRPVDSVPAIHFFVGYYGEECAGRRIARTAREMLQLMSGKNESRDRLYAAICAPRSVVMSDSLK